jgi:hypothetical protein
MALPKVFPFLVIVLLMLSSLIEPLKTEVDGPRGTMNCPNTVSFNQTAWSNLNARDHMTYSTSCYFLNWTVLLFIGLLSAFAVWGWMT